MRQTLLPFAALAVLAAASALAGPAKTPPTPPTAATPATPATPGAPGAGATPATPAAPAAPVGKRTFAIDVKHSTIVIQVFKDGAAAALAHDHVVEAHDFTGTIVADPADPTSATVSVTAQTASFVNDEAKLRTKYGLESEVSDKDRKAVGESMRSKDQLDVAGHPTVKFVSTSVKAAEGGKYTLAGKLTLHGVTKDVTMPFEAKIDGDAVDGKASFRLKTSDYGIKPYSAFLGAVKNKDEIVLHLHLVGHAK